jgi:hypothetical protein
MANLGLGIEIKHSWLVSYGSTLEIDNKIFIHPYDYACLYGYIHKDPIKALDLLKRFIQDEIDKK